MTKKTLQEIYDEYRLQIDAIQKIPGMKGRQAGRIIAWFYGGTAEGWRKFLRTKGGTQKVPKEVEALLSLFRKK